MVKLNPDRNRMELIRELEESKERAEKELKDMEKKLETAVEEINEQIEQEELETEGEELETELEQEGIPLEERVRDEQEERMATEGGPVYEVKGSDLENLPELYDQVKQDIEAGKFMSDNVQNAMDMIYTLNKAESRNAYVARDAHNIVRKDQEEAQYVNRLETLFEQVKEQTSVYKS